ncbi:hypothetical protein FGO68_gene6490 [Halteria grandinella]|uniref:Uncharacterized protein n=1 Tax=Halteria grandinella TaxID=5974 RepID=A0A8J8NZC7_HALGN|nr:hypothetical protein FGO68_gene6490 [Halteria grandinella]
MLDFNIRSIRLGFFIQNKYRMQKQQSPQQTSSQQQWQQMPVTNFPNSTGAAHHSLLSKHGASLESTTYKGASEYTLYHPPNMMPPQSQFIDHRMILSKENKMLRFKITDFTAQQPIQNVLIKLWRLIAQIQYDVKKELTMRKSIEDFAQSKNGPQQQEPNLLGMNISQQKSPSTKAGFKQTANQSQQSKEPAGGIQEIEYSILPVDLTLYEQVMFIFKRALGVLYETDYYVAKKVPPQPQGANYSQSTIDYVVPDQSGGYLKPHVFFDRFCFDIISLLGDYLNLLSFTDVEYVMRKVYQHSTHFAVSDNEASVKLLRYDCVETPFTWEIMSAFEPEQIDKLLEKPQTPLAQEPDPTPPIKEKGKNDTLYNEREEGDEGEEEGLDEDEDDDDDDEKDIKIPMNNGRLLDLTRMLDQKKKAQEAKKKKVDALVEKQKQLVPYNPLVTKEAIDSRMKEIINYKNKISQEKYFQSTVSPTKIQPKQLLSPISNKTTHLEVSANKGNSLLMNKIGFSGAGAVGVAHNNQDIHQYLGSNDSGTSPLRDAYDFNEFAAVGMQPMISPAKEKLKKIEMKTLELKKMEGMEDITNFFSGINTNALDDDEDAEKDKDQIDRKQLEIMKKLNFRHRDPGAVYRHRKSQERLEYDIMTNFTASKDNLYSLSNHYYSSTAVPQQEYSLKSNPHMRVQQFTYESSNLSKERLTKKSTKEGTKFPTVFVSNENDTNSSEKATSRLYQQEKTPFKKPAYNMHHQRGSRLSVITGTPGIVGEEDLQPPSSNLPPILSNKELFNSPKKGKIPLHTILTTGNSDQMSSSIKDNATTRYIFQSNYNIQAPKHTINAEEAGSEQVIAGFRSSVKNNQDFRRSLIQSNGQIDIHTTKHSPPPLLKIPLAAQKLMRNRNQLMTNFKSPRHLLLSQAATFQSKPINAHTMNNFNESFMLKSHNLSNFTETTPSNALQQSLHNLKGMMLDDTINVQKIQPKPKLTGFAAIQSLKAQTSRKPERITQQKNQGLLNHLSPKEQLDELRQMDSKITIDGNHLYNNIRRGGRQAGASISNTGGAISGVLGGMKSKAYIHAIPMQDYQLEKWRQAYHSKETAIKHFQTGASSVSPQ